MAALCLSIFSTAQQSSGSPVQHLPSQHYAVMWPVWLLHLGDGESLHVQRWAPAAARAHLTHSFKKWHELNPFFFLNLFIKACKLICHKKCLSKIITDCSTRQAKQVGTDLQNSTTNITVRFDESTNVDGFCALIVCAALVSPFSLSRMWQDENTPGSLHFGVQVYMLTSKANPVPKVIEMLLIHVEINGLYTEGLYRKSGSACRAKELHQILETGKKKNRIKLVPVNVVKNRT